MEFAGHEAIDLAQSMGVDVIVTDHHSLPEVLPDALSNRSSLNTQSRLSI